MSDSEHSDSDHHIDCYDFKLLLDDLSNRKCQRLSNASQEMLSASGCRLKFESPACVDRPIVDLQGYDEDGSEDESRFKQVFDLINNFDEQPKVKFGSSKHLTPETHLPSVRNQFVDDAYSHRKAFNIWGSTKRARIDKSSSHRKSLTAFSQAFEPDELPFPAVPREVTGSHQRQAPKKYSMAAGDGAVEFFSHQKQNFRKLSVQDMGFIPIQLSSNRQLQTKSSRKKLSLFVRPPNDQLLLLIEQGVDKLILEQDRREFPRL